MMDVLFFLEYVSTEFHTCVFTRHTGHKQQGPLSRGRAGCEDDGPLSRGRAGCHRATGRESQRGCHRQGVTGCHREGVTGPQAGCHRVSQGVTGPQAGCHRQGVTGCHRATSSRDH